MVDNAHRVLCTLYYLWLNHATGKIGQKNTNTIHHLEAKLTCLLNDYTSITSHLCTAENTSHFLSLQSLMVARYLIDDCKRCS